MPLDFSPPFCSPDPGAKEKHCVRPRCIVHGSWDAFLPTLSANQASTKACGRRTISSIEKTGTWVTSFGLDETYPTTAVSKIHSKKLNGPSLPGYTQPPCVLSPTHLVPTRQLETDRTGMRSPAPCFMRSWVSQLEQWNFPIDQMAHGPQTSTVLQAIFGDMPEGLYVLFSPPRFRHLRQHQTSLSSLLRACQTKRIVQHGEGRCFPA